MDPKVHGYLRGTSKETLLALLYISLKSEVAEKILEGTAKRRPTNFFKNLRFFHDLITFWDAKDRTNILIIFYKQLQPWPALEGHLKACLTEFAGNTWILRVYFRKSGKRLAIVSQIWLKIGINFTDYMPNITAYYNFTGKNPAIFGTALNSDNSN
jgi:hypothetical protein